MTSDEFARFEAQRSPVVWIEGTPWRASGRVLEPLRMPHLMRPVARGAVRRAMRQTKALVARWNDAWDTAPGEWWWISCDARSYDAEALASRSRRDVRAGLRRCEVRRLETAWVAANGYETYAAAHRRYGASDPPLSQAEFHSHISAFAALPESGSEWWGAFVGGVLASLSHCYVLDEAVSLAWLKADPAHFKALPNNALVYALTRHYLVEQGLRYVTAGVRVLGHETQFQDFLEGLGYRRVYCPLRVELSPLARLALGSGVRRWGRLVGLGQWAAGPLGKLDAVAELVRLAQKEKL